MQSNDGQARTKRQMQSDVPDIEWFPVVIEVKGYYVLTIHKIIKVNEWQRTKNPI